MLSGSNILITGAQGYVGQYIVNALLNAGYAPDLLGRKNKNYWPQLTFLEIDLTDTNALQKYSKSFKKYNIVIHLASNNEQFDSNYFRDAYTVNTLATKNLIHYLSDSPELTNFIYFSTIHVYGNSAGLIKEDTPTLPLSDYALSHLFAEELIKMQDRVSKFPYTIFRLSNGFGLPLFKSNKGYLFINDLITSALNTKKIVIKSNPGIKRDFIPLRLVADVVLKIIVDKKKCGKVFNLSLGKSFTLQDIALVIKECYKKTNGDDLELIFNTEFSPTPEYCISNKKLLSYMNVSELKGSIEEEIMNMFEAK